MTLPRLNSLNPEMDFDCLDTRSASVQQRESGPSMPCWPELTVDQVRVLVKCIRRAANEPKGEP